MSRKNRNKETSVEDVKKDEQLNEDAIQKEESVSEQQGAEGTEGAEPAQDDASGEGEQSGEDPAEGEAPVAEQPEEQPAIELVPAAALAALAEEPVQVEPEVLQSFGRREKSDRVEALTNYVREYIDRMDPSKYHDAKSGVPLQARLYRLLAEMMKLDYVEFKDAMDELLKLVFEYRHAAFSDLYSRRFFEALYPTLTHDQVRAFDEILSIIVTVGSATNRQRAMKHIDLGAALKSVKDAKSQQNMSAYFGALR